jgi:hypothetical protein
MRYFFLIVLIFIMGCASKNSPIARDATDQDCEKESNVGLFSESMPDSADVECAKLRNKYLEMGLSENFSDLLSKMGLDFVIPAQFEAVAGEQNSIWEYDYALVAKSKKVEIRFKVIPGELKLPEGVAYSPDLNSQRIVSMNLLNTIIRINGASLVADIQNFPETEARSRFNAHAYTTATFVPDKKFANYEIGSAGVFFKEGVGKVFIVALLNGMDDPQTRVEWITGANSIRFLK